MDKRTVTSLSLGGTFFLFALIGIGMWGCPQYNVWEQGLAGEAALARATQDRQIRIEEAKAKLESAQLESEAEVLRAEGVAASVAKIEDKLTEAYLRYRFILMLEETGGKGRETIYIPTEGGMPILEAGRLGESNTQ